MIADLGSELEQSLARRAPLDAFFHPRKIAVIGATEEQGSVGRTLLWNLMHARLPGHLSMEWFSP